jgi:hypothetical protein
MPAGRPRNKPLTQEQLVCTGLVRSLLPFRQRFITPSHPVHGNRKLELGDVVMVMLCAFFNPTVRSQRLIEQFSQLDWVRQHLDVDAVRRSTLSDALRDFEPEQLKGLIRRLMREVPPLRRMQDGKDLERVCQQILAADGSYWTVPADVICALRHRKRNGKTQGQVRLNLQLDVRNWMPAEVSVSTGDRPGEGSEAAAFADELHEGVIYLVDRLFVNFGFINAVLAKNSDLVLRLRKSDQFESQQPLPLRERDLAAGVLSDSLGIMPGSSQKRGRSRTTPPPRRVMRLVEVMGTGREAGKRLRILTSLLDLPAQVIADLFHHRWQIELFLRWLKVWANFAHLFAHHPSGITLQFYVAVIACLLMHLATGRKPNRYSLMLLGEVAAGRTTLEQILPLLDKIEREKQLERERLARKRAQKALLKKSGLLPA